MTEAWCLDACIILPLLRSIQIIKPEVEIKIYQRDKNEDLMNLYAKFHVWETIGRKISDINFIISHRRLRSMMNDDAATRYRKYQHSYQNLLHRIPQHIVASYLGITPQSLSRLKREIEGSGE